MKAYSRNPFKGKTSEDQSLIDTILRDSAPLTFHESLKQYAPTPLVSLPGLAQKLGLGKIMVKDESKRFGLNAFKGLGASYAVHRYMKENPGTHVFATATDGNHGRALAWAAAETGADAVIYVPSFTAEERIKNIEALGAQVITVEGDYDFTVNRAMQESEKKGHVLVQDTSWPGYSLIPGWIVAGYMTLCMETDNQAQAGSEPPFDLVLLQSGVGSFAGSVIWHYTEKYGDKSPAFIVVEPEGSAGALTSIRSSSLSVPENPGPTIMAGLNCGIPSAITWPVLKNHTDFFVAVKDSHAEDAMRQLFFPENGDPVIVSGESGSAGLAGLLRLVEDEDFKEAGENLGLSSETRVLVINTEGDTDRKNFQKITGTHRS